MTQFDDKFEAVARKLVAKFSGDGEVSASIAYFDPAQTVYDPSTGVATKGGEETISAPCTPLLGVRVDDLGEGFPVQMTDSKIFFVGADLKLADGTLVEIPEGARVTLSSGKVFSVVYTKPLVSGSRTAAVAVFLRGG